MKTRFPSILGVFAAILMVASFVVPMNIAAPSAVSADPGIMKWDIVSTPGHAAAKNDILNDYQDGLTMGLDMPRGSEILDMAVANDGMTEAFIVRTNLGPAGTTLSAALGGAVPAAAFWNFYANEIYVSNNNGIYSSQAKELALFRAQNFGLSNLYQVAIAPDDPKFMAVTCDVNGGLIQLGIFADPVTGAPITLGPTRMYVTTDGGANWDVAFDGTMLSDNETIRDLDISIDYGGKRDIGFITQHVTFAGGADAGRWFVRPSAGFNTWLAQLAPNSATTLGDGFLQYQAIKFSPTYNGDSSVVLVYSDVTGVPATDVLRYNVAFRDLSTSVNNVVGWAFNPGIIVKTPTAVDTDSPTAVEVNNVCLQLPSDFSGQSASLRRAYISVDPNGHGAGINSGIFRMDDTTIYQLMDTMTTVTKNIYSIAYFGTYASGKLLAGERFGFPCTATVPTWFTDSPTTCPIPCWYPALKPTTGAADQGACTVGTQDGAGSAIVGWNADGSLGLVTTGSCPAFFYNAVSTTIVFLPAPHAIFTQGWWIAFVWPVIHDDENAFAISRNNGETWNQISLIDTTVDWFNDVAVAPDCTTIYLASVNRNNGLLCDEFDSVWRATINPNVAAPMPAVPPLGFYWERVFCHVTSGNCGVAQTDLPILRVVNSCTDKKDGEVVGWAAQLAGATYLGAPASYTGAGIMAWSPDFGDYWAMIGPRFPVQDFAFESSTTLYVVSTGGLVQRMPYTGTSWSTNLPSYDTTLLSAHTIVAVPDGKVLVGAGNAGSPAFSVAYSGDKGVSFMDILDTIVGHGQEHVIFDVDFKNNSFIYMGDDDTTVGTTIGTVYRNTVPSYTKWVDNDMMSRGNGNGYIFAGEPLLAWPALNDPPHIVGQFGIAQAWTGDPQPALYSAHAQILTSLAAPPVAGVAALVPWNSAVCRTLKPRDGMPKPGIRWDCLDIFAPLSQTGVAFTLEPSSLKYCGCCTLDTNTTLYAIDDESGDWTWVVAAGFGTGTYALTRNGRWNNHYNHVALPADPLFPGYTPKLRQGMLWAYTDCLAKKGPILKGPADKFLIGADPVTGRNQQIDLSWEQLCLSTWYQLQIAKDAAFTLRINPAVNWAGGGTGVISAVTGSILLQMDAVNMTAPAAWIAPGALPEAGAIYYWRIRSARSATSQIAASPWSEARSFTVKAGFIVNTPYYGVQLLAPNNGCLGCKVKPASFSWSPWKEATKYQFDLAKDPEFKTLVVTATTTTTGYEYSGTLDYSTNYFWRVKALEVNGLNIPSDWSATFSMQTEPAPAPPAPPPAEPATPLWVWVIIAIGAILVIVTLILIFKTRRV